MTGYESEFTQAHSRIAAHAEEIAFLGGETCERKILDTKLNQLLNFRLVLAEANWKQNFLDQWIIKYCSSILGLIVIEYPLNAECSVSNIGLDSGV